MTKVLSVPRSKRYYIGTNPPVVEHIKNEEPLSYNSEHEAKCAEGDYMPMDEQGYDQFKENE